MSTAPRTLPTALAELPVATIDTGRIRAALLATLNLRPFVLDEAGQQRFEIFNAIGVHHSASLLGLMDVAEAAACRIDSHVAGGEVQP